MRRGEEQKSGSGEWWKRRGDFERAAGMALKLVVGVGWRDGRPAWRQRDAAPGATMSCAV